MTGFGGRFRRGAKEVNYMSITELQQLVTTEESEMSASSVASYGC